MAKKKKDPLQKYAVARFRDFKFEQEKAINNKKNDLVDQLWLAVPKNLRKYLDVPMLLEIVDYGVAFKDFIPERMFEDITLKQIELDLKALRRALEGVVRVIIRRFAGGIRVEYKAVKAPRKRKTDLLCIQS